MAITDETSKVIRKEIDRLSKEREELGEMIQKLEDALVSTTRKAGRISRQAVTGKKKAGRRKKTASKDWKPSGRAAEILKIVKANPGISTGDIAKKAKMNNSASVYPPLNKLKDNGFVRKSGKGYAAK